MQRNKLSVIRDYIVKHCKIFFPVIVVAVIAFTVTVALLRMDWGNEPGESTLSEENSSGVDNDEVLNLDEIPEVPLLANEDEAIYTLVKAYYNAQATGDLDTMRSLFDTISENNLQYYKALSEYIDHYAEIQVNTKQGLEEGSVVAYIYYRVCFINHEEEFPGSNMLYICTNDEGKLYIKSEDGFTEEEETYIGTVSAQDDVSEFRTRVKVEYNDFMRDNPALLAYLEEVINQVSIDWGVALADQNQSNNQTGTGGEGQSGEDAVSTPEPEEVPVTPEYATATTTVNVRSSDSEQADKLGRVPTGTRVKVQEVGVNGWTKVVFEGADGYIKSEFLEFAESAAGQEVIGTVTADTNINVRAGASQTAEKLGMLSGGESLDLLAIEGDWCKVIFNGQVAYVKAEFVQQH